MRFHFAAVLATGLLMSWAIPAAAGPADDGRAIAQRLRTVDPIPGLSVAVIRDGKVVWAEAFGEADLELGVPATNATRYRYASVSKLVTAAITLRLAERGVVDLDAPISTWFADLPEQHRNTTLRQLLGHQAGVRHYWAGDYNEYAPGGPIDARNYRATRDALAVFIKDPLESPPGAKYRYSTFAFTLVAAVLEAAAKKPFLDLVRDEVSGPLHLTSLGPDRPLQIEPNRSHFYGPSASFRQDGPLTGAVVNAPAINPAYKWAGGGLISTATDMARFGAAHLQPGFLTAASLKTAFTLQTLKDGAPTTVGITWRVDKDARGRVRYSHTGSQAGSRSVLVLYPDLKLSIAITSNMTSMPEDIRKPAEMLADAFDNDPATKADLAQLKASVPE